MSMPMDELTDERLVEAVRSGDDEAFAELVRRYKRKVLITASRFVQGRYELDDLSQDIFMKVYQNIGKFRGDAPFEHWLMRIAVHACYDMLRGRRRERQNVPLDDMDFALGGPVALDNLTALQARDMLDKAMAGLKPEERLVITLIELQELSVKEVARLTGWSESNVKVRSFRARQMLKKIIGVENETEQG
jgi:RNA polymerase sigma-70 factor (ECF subfamily)